MTVFEWVQKTAQALVKSGIHDAHQEAKWLVAHALNKDSSFLLLNPTYIPSQEEADRLDEWVNRRLKGEPLSRIKGFREFWSLPFHLNAHTLDPRPESETLVEGVLARFEEDRSKPLKILDLGTGSGCLLIALLHEFPKARGLGIDLEEGALEQARFNATLNHVGSRAHFSQGHWGKDLKSSFDIIVSNPPYIPLRDKNKLHKNVVNFDPSLALFAGEDGLEAYRTIRHDIYRLLPPNGLAMIELGAGQREAVETLFQEVGLKTSVILKDLAGIERALGVVSGNMGPPFASSKELDIPPRPYGTTSPTRGRLV